MTKSKSDRIYVKLVYVLTITLITIVCINRPPLLTIYYNPLKIITSFPNSRIKIKNWFLKTKYNYIPTPSNASHKEKRIIWMFWLQGWENAPDKEKQISQMWISYNPSWTVILLDKHNLKQYLPNHAEFILKDKPNVQCISDLIRLNLLNEHGGIWSDASCYPTKPLNDWIWEKTKQSPFWMHNGSHTCCGWFLASFSNSHVLKMWTFYMNQYFIDEMHKTTFEYFLMDVIFNFLIMYDDKARNEWNSVEYLWRTHHTKYKLHVKDPNVFVVKTHKMQKKIL